MQCKIYFFSSNLFFILKFIENKFKQNIHIHILYLCHFIWKDIVYNSFQLSKFPTLQNIWNMFSDAHSLIHQ